MLYNWQSIKLNPTTTTHKSIIYSVFSDKLFNWQSTHYNYIVHLLLHFRKISFANNVSDILDLWGLRIMPPWLNTRSTGALDAGTLGALAAGITNLARVCRWACQKDMQQSKWCTIAVTVNGYQYLSLKYQYPCLKYKYQYFSSKYQYKYLKMVLKYRSSTSTSTQYYNPGVYSYISANVSVLENESWLPYWSVAWSSLNKL